MSAVSSVKRAPGSGARPPVRKAPRLSAGPASPVHVSYVAHGATATSPERLSGAAAMKPKRTAAQALRDRGVKFDTSKAGQVSIRVRSGALRPPKR